MPIGKIRVQRDRPFSLPNCHIVLSGPQVDAGKRPMGPRISSRPLFAPKVIAPIPVPLGDWVGRCATSAAKRVVLPIAWSLHPRE